MTTGRINQVTTVRCALRQVPHTFDRMWRRQQNTHANFGLQSCDKSLCRNLDDLRKLVVVSLLSCARRIVCFREKHAVPVVYSSEHGQKTSPIELYPGRTLIPFTAMRNHMSPPICQVYEIFLLNINQHGRACFGTTRQRATEI